MLTHWKQESKKEGSVYDSTFPYVPTVHELRVIEDAIQTKVETMGLLEKQKEGKLEYEDCPSYSCRVRIQGPNTPQVSEGPKFTLKSFFTLEEVIQCGWIERIDQGVMMSLALDG